jgi:small subunit ribosomal protein S4e
MKRLAAPRKWSIPRKQHKWVVKPSPGAHGVYESIPLLIIIRDLLEYCDTAREGKRIIGARDIMIDGKVATNPKQPIGFMNVISISKLKENYRVMLDTRGKFTLVKIPTARAKWKLSRLENKTTVRNGKIQLNLYDGRNILVKKDNYKTGDVLKIELPSQKILDSYPLKEGNVAMIIGGKHVGQIAAIKDYMVTRSPKPNIVLFKEGFSTIKSNVFVVGGKSPVIKIPEVKIL